MALVPWYTLVECTGDTGEREERGTTAVGITTPPRLVGGRSRAVESLMIDGVVLGSVLEVQDKSVAERVEAPFRVDLARAPGAGGWDSGLLRTF